MTSDAHNSADRPPPAFQEYASDWLASRIFRECNLAERGLLMTMRLECWANQSVPANPESLARVLGFSKSEIEAAFSARVQSFFAESGGQLVCPELDAYRAKLARGRLAMSAGGRRGGKRTQDQHRNNQATLEGRLKPLSRDEQKRGEWNKKELSGGGEVDDLSDDDWVKEYDAYSEQETKAVRRFVKDRSSSKRI
jgi:uncharacterized protein YdaU (DUF1376 family)